MRVYNLHILTNVVMNTTINSAALEVREIFGYSIQAVFTGTPAGTFKLQASSDPCPNATNTPPTNWTDIAGSSQGVSAAGNIMWNVHDVEYNWVRLVYTDSSSGASTAVLNATINSKGF